MAFLQTVTTQANHRPQLPEEETEQVLLTRLTAGDDTAFWAIWERYRAELLTRYCLRWMDGNREDAEDALSSASLKARERLGQYAHDLHNVKGWLVRLLYNHCMDLRRQLKKTVRLQQALAADVGSHWGRAQAVDEGPESRVLRYEMECKIAWAINRLPPRLREPSRLYYMFHMTSAEIAAALDRYPANIRKCLQQARKRLHVLLKPYWEDVACPVKADVSARVRMPLHGLHLLSVSRPEMRLPHAFLLHPVAIRMLKSATTAPGDRHAYRALDQPPTGNKRTLATQQTEGQRHDAEWKRRLRLAACLYAMGRWEEAITSYHHILQTQPRCLLAWLRLGEMLRLLHRQHDAFTTYRKALAWFRSAAVREYLQGHMALCLGRYPVAMEAFQAATGHEPGQAGYWHALSLDPQPVLARQHQVEHRLSIVWRWGKAERETQALMKEAPYCCVMWRLSSASAWQLYRPLAVSGRLGLASL